MMEPLTEQFHSKRKAMGCHNKLAFIMRKDPRFWIQKMLRDCQEWTDGTLRTLPSTEWMETYGVDYLKNKEGWIPIVNALDSRLNYNYLVDQDGWNPIHYAVVSNEIDMVKALAPLMTSPNQSGPNGITPIAFAARLGLADIIKYLAPRCDFPNLPDDDGLTPLYKAAFHGHASVIKALAPFKPHLTGYHGSEENAHFSFQEPNFPSLWIAKYRGNQECVEVLMALWPDLIPSNFPRLLASRPPSPSFHQFYSMRL